MSSRARRDPAGRGEEAVTAHLEGAGAAGLHVDLGSCSPVGCARMPAFGVGRGGTTQLLHGSGNHRHGVGAEGPLMPTPGTPMSPEPGTHMPAAPTYAGWHHPRLRDAAVPVPRESGGMLQHGITEDIKPFLGHGRDLLLLGCGQVLQEASSARQGWMLAGSKAGMGTKGQPHHATLHSQPRSTETPCTGHTTSGTQRIQTPLRLAERQVMPPRLGDRDATVPWELKAHAVRVPLSPVGPNGPGAHCDPHPKAAKPRRAPGQRLRGTLLLLMPCVAGAQTPPAGH